MSLNALLVALLVLGACHIAIADDKQEICGDIVPNVDDPSDEFQFEDDFKVHVESVLPEMGRVANSWMEFSAEKQMVKTTLKSKGWDYALYHDYAFHQTLVYNFGDTGRGSCKVDFDMRERLGFFLVPENPKIGSKLSTSDLFRLTGLSGFGDDKISLKKGTTTTFRALSANQYYSCQKITTSDGSQIIVKVTHLTSNTKVARTESGTVPLQIVFKGKYVSGDNKGKDLDHTYNFFHYTTSVGDDDFQTPQGIVCPNRKSEGTFPEPPLHIRFGQEIHYSETSEINTIRTTYDKEFNFVTEEIFDPRPGKLAEFRFDDFYAGLSYNIDPNTMFCAVLNISETTKVNDFKAVKGGKISMMTPEQFWDKEGIDYHYNGKKHFRGLETEVWIGKDDETGRMYEWYFTYGVKYTVNDYAKSEQTEVHRIPYKRLFWFDDTDKFYSTYYFQVDLTEPPLLFDLSACFPNQQKLVSLFVAGLTRERAEKDQLVIVRRAVKTLTKELNIPFTRIARPSITFQGEKGYILFSLLERPLHSSDLVTQHDDQPTLAEVYATLVKKTKSRELAFYVGNKDEFVQGEAKIEEWIHNRPNKVASGYSPGAMAGLSMAMIVIGLAAGGGGGYWFFIRR